MTTDPIELAAQARVVIKALHQLDDVVVRFKTKESDYHEDQLAEEDYDAEGKEIPGHFKTDKHVLTLNLDTLIKEGKPRPEKLTDVEDFRAFPVLAGVAAHESGHARWSKWGDAGMPDSIPNPDFDPAHAEKEIPNPLYVQSDADKAHADGIDYPVSETIIDPDYHGGEWFPVRDNGALHDLTMYLEEPRIERLGTGNFTKTWRRAMQFSAGHLILEQVDAMNEEDTSALDSAVKLAILVGGRVTAGTLGATQESRDAVKKILDSASSIIEKAVAEFEPEDRTPDPYHKIMGILSKSIFGNEHEDPIPHLEASRQILKIVHPETKNNPDEKPGEGEGEGGAGAGAGADPTGAMAAALAELKEGLGELDGAIEDMVEVEEENPETEVDKTHGYGSTLFKNPKAPQIDHHEQPTSADRELYRRAVDWMERQVQPTVSETSYGQWLPGGGARLNIRQFIKDNLAGNYATERSDWDRLTQTIKQAPPVKVGIMLDGSGSMRDFARPSASIAWAASNAAAMLPESRTISVVYGDAAGVTQPPGHAPARTVAVSKTNHGTESFIEAAELVEEGLWLDDRFTEETDGPSNVLIIIVSDLAYYGMHRVTKESQIAGFHRITAEWAEKGYQIVVVGPDPGNIRAEALAAKRGFKLDREVFESLTPDELFR